MTLSIRGVIATLSITAFCIKFHHAECHYAEFRDLCYCYAECRYAEFRYAQCHYAGCRYAECHGAFVNRAKYFSS
jgi:hypothetical protein